MSTERSECEFCDATAVPSSVSTFSAVPLCLEHLIWAAVNDPDRDGWVAGLNNLATVVARGLPAAWPHVSIAEMVALLGSLEKGSPTYAEVEAELADRRAAVERMVAAIR